MVIQTDEMKLRAELRKKPTQELKEITKKPYLDFAETEFERVRMAREILFERGKLR